MAQTRNKRSLTIARHRTSVSLEDEFWEALGDIRPRRRQIGGGADRRDRPSSEARRQAASPACRRRSGSMCWNGCSRESPSRRRARRCPCASRRALPAASARSAACGAWPAAAPGGPAPPRGRLSLGLRRAFGGAACGGVSEAGKAIAGAGGRVAARSASSVLAFSSARAASLASSCLDQLHGGGHRPGERRSLRHLAARAAWLQPADGSGSGSAGRRLGRREIHFRLDVCSGMAEVCSRPLRLRRSGRGRSRRVSPDARRPPACGAW